MDIRMFRASELPVRDKPPVTAALVRDVIAEVEAHWQEQRKLALAKIQIDALVRCVGVAYVEQCLQEITQRRDAAQAGDPRR